MKRKILTDVDCMSGSGWMPDDCECFKCPVCNNKIDIINETTLKCSECGSKLRVEKGVQQMSRIVVSHASYRGVYTY